MPIKYYKIDKGDIGFFCDACGKRIESLTGGGVLGDEKTGDIYFFHKGTGCCEFIQKKYNNGKGMPWGDLYDLVKSLLFEFVPRKKWNDTRNLLKKIFYLCPNKNGHPTKVTFWEEIF